MLTIISFKTSKTKSLKLKQDPRKLIRNFKNSWRISKREALRNIKYKKLQALLNIWAVQPHRSSVGRVLMINSNLDPLENKAISRRTKVTATPPAQLRRSKLKKRASDVTLLRRSVSCLLNFCCCRLDGDVSADWYSRHTKFLWASSFL